MENSGAKYMLIHADILIYVMQVCLYLNSHLFYKKNNGIKNESVSELNIYIIGNRLLDEDVISKCQIYLFRWSLNTRVFLIPLVCRHMLNLECFLCLIWIICSKWS